MPAEVIPADPSPADETRWNRWIFHPFLFAIHPLLHFLANNLREVAYTDVVRTGLVLLLFAAVIWSVAGLCLRSFMRSAAVASCLIVFSLDYGHVHEGMRGIFHLRQFYFLPLWSLILIGIAVLVAFRMTQASVAKLNQSMNFGAVALMIMAGLLAAWNHTHAPPVLASLPPLEGSPDFDALPQDELPDIYYLIFDGYGRLDKIQKNYEFDNSAFVNALKERGFFVVENGLSNYSTTAYSLSSSLNMNYLISDTEPGHSLIKRNRVVVNLQRGGYRYILISSQWGPTADSPIANEVIRVSAKHSEMERQLFEATPFWALYCAATREDSIDHLVATGLAADMTGLTKWREHIVKSISAIGTSAEESGPKFVFAHVICPHPPYIFASDGSLPTQGSVGDFSDQQHPWTSKLYASQVSHLNAFILEAVDKIIERSNRRTIIVLQGDHGTMSNLTDGNISDPPEELIRERMSILFACRASPKVQEKLRHDMTPVNLFRIIFNAEFGADFELLPDKCYWSHTFPCRDVTEIAR